MSLCSKRCIHKLHSHEQRNAVQPNVKDEIPGCCANSVHTATFFKLLLREKIAYVEPLPRKQGCVWSLRTWLEGIE